jgi:hypothetical protein
VTDVDGALTPEAELLDTLVTPDPPSPWRRWRWPIIVLALVLVTAAAALGVFVVGRDSGPKGPPHPAKWDARVQKYVDFVEKKRNLKFKQPVYVDFLSAKDFKKQITADRDQLSADDEKQLEQVTGMFRALGLFEGDVDLFAKYNELQGKGIIGFYSYDDERLRVRGTELTPYVEDVLVHELTHALQDQNFDLGKRFDELDKADDANSSAASSGFDALVEGDARRIEDKWRDSLTDEQRAALDAEKAAGAKGFENRSKDIPEVLVTMLSAPYDLGQALLAVAVQQGGDDEVDNLFRSPPKTEEQQLDPWTLVADHQGLLTVPKPELPDGAKSFDDGAFGALTWLMVLSERLPAAQALTAVDGWGGDSYAAYDLNGTSCVMVDYRADTPQDLGEMQGALQAWAAKVPNGSVSVTREAVTLVFTSCDPGKHAAKVASGKSMDAVAVALSRTYLSLELVKAGMDVDVARCGADHLVRDFTIAQLNDPKLDQARVLRAIQPCRKKP